jgi:hypothetical protein
MPKEKVGTIPLQGKERKKRQKKKKKKGERYRHLKLVL